MSNEDQKHIVWHQTKITKQNRQKLNGHKSMMLWFTGLSGAGKSTVASALENKLYEKGIHTYLLDGDNVRHGLNQDLGFTSEDRKENIRRLAEIGKLFVDAGIVVLCAAISPFQKEREQAKQIVGKDDFIEVYIKCSVEECEKRDPKGLYKKARTGEIQQFTGISQPYEEPQHPDIIIDTTNQSIENSVFKLMKFVEKNL